MLLTAHLETLPEPFTRHSMLWVLGESAGRWQTSKNEVFKGALEELKACYAVLF
jgi:hypothetical protein